jgi:5'-deoxynucleotidase
MTPVSHFFAYINRLRWIKRWSLMRNAIEEDVAVHSWEVATIAHALGIIHNQLWDEKIDANKLATAAIYHDATEVITGDMPTPVKYHSETMKSAYKNVERQAQNELLLLLPPAMQDEFKEILVEELLPEVYQVLLKAADRLSALLKCRAELRAGNREFEHAEKQIEKRLNEEDRPEVRYFLEVFAPSYELTLDNLLEN